MANSLIFISARPSISGPSIGRYDPLRVILEGSDIPLGDAYPNSNIFRIEDKTPLDLKYLMSGLYDGDGNFIRVRKYFYNYNRYVDSVQLQEIKDSTTWNFITINESDFKERVF